MTTTPLVSTHRFFSFVFILLLASLAGCSSEADTIQLGTMLVLSDSGSPWGQPTQNGIQMAAEEINARGGIRGKRIVLTHENDKDDPKTALTLLEQFLAKDIHIIIGPSWSTAGRSIAPRACQEDILLISPTIGTAQFNEACDRLFTLWPHDAASAQRLGEKIYSDGHRTIAIIGIDWVWYRDLAESVKVGFEQQGGNVVSLELADAQGSTSRELITKSLSFQPDAIVFSNFDHEHISAKRLQELSPTTIHYSAFIDPTHLTDDMEGVISFDARTPTPEFSTTYHTRFGEPPSHGSDTGYDAVYLLKEAIESTGSTEPADIAGYLRTKRDYFGASGNLKFDGKGGITKDAKYVVVKNHALEPI